MDKQSTLIGFNNLNIKFLLNFHNSLLINENKVHLLAEWYPVLQFLQYSL